ncbi:MAG: rod shape-determining protein MreC [Lachnospiraceae bacterium]|nr:rod shape-determining protein MreC [Lachnospiraceae bacterium]
MNAFESIKKFFKNLIHRLSSKAALFIVIGLCLAALFLQYFKRDDAISLLSVAGAVVVPFQEGVNEVGRFLFERESDRLSLQEANARIKELEDENAALRREIDGYHSVAKRNAELRKLLNAKMEYDFYDVSAASVIGNDGINIFGRFTINQGSSDGIEKDMNVINGDGALIGIVSFVGLNYSIVTSIIENGVSISAMTLNGNENCIVTGNLSDSGASLLRLENALVDVDFSKDSALVTSNISDKYLPGLKIGYVTDVTVNADGLTQSGYVKTAADFTRIREVLIIRQAKGVPDE